MCGARRKQHLCREASNVMSVAEVKDVHRSRQNRLEDRPESPVRGSKADDLNRWIPHELLPGFGAAATKKQQRDTRAVERRKWNQVEGHQEQVQRKRDAKEHRGGLRDPARCDGPYDVGKGESFR